MSALTEVDLATLDACQCYDDWFAACKQIKAAHGGRYPSDWHAIVLKGGLGNRILARWGMDMGVQTTKIEPGESLADARKKLEFAARPRVQCKECEKSPDQIPEYVEMAEDEPDVYKTPTAAAKTDGTYNPATGNFYCTTCYLRLGQPLGKA